MKNQPRIVFDFDGVIHSYISGWLGPHIIPDKPVDGIKDTIDRLKNNYEIAIQSSRCSSPEGLKAIQTYCLNNDIYYDTIWAEKPPAVIYVDDRAICFNGNAEHLYNQICHFKPYMVRNEKPYCPFCGSDKIKIVTKQRKATHDKDRISYYATCNCCHARGPVVGEFIDGHRATPPADIAQKCETDAISLWSSRT